MNKQCHHQYKTADGDCYSCSIVKKQLEDPLIIKKRKEGANIRKKFFNVTFEDFFKNCKDKEIMGYAKKMQDYDLSYNIVMAGTTGTGKTHLAVATLIEAIKKGYTGYYTKFYELTRMQINDHGKFERICNVDLLVIDEFGVATSDYKSELLFQIIDNRYDNEQYTIIISNKDEEEIEGIMTDATYSRLVENSVGWTFNGVDFRLRKVDGKNG